MVLLASEAVKEIPDSKIHPQLGNLKCYILSLKDIDWIVRNLHSP
jgi:hypothetical protein